MAGVYAWAFMDGKAKGGFKNDTFSIECEQTCSVVGDVVRFLMIVTLIAGTKSMTSNSGWISADWIYIL